MHYVAPEQIGKKIFLVKLTFIFSWNVHFEFQIWFKWFKGFQRNVNTCLFTFSCRCLLPCLLTLPAGCVVSRSILLGHLNLNPKLCRKWADSKSYKLMILLGEMLWGKSAFCQLTTTLSSIYTHFLQWFATQFCTVFFRTERRTETA